MVTATFQLYETPTPPKKLLFLGAATKSELKSPTWGEEHVEYSSTWSSFKQILEPEVVEYVEMFRLFVTWKVAFC